MEHVHYKPDLEPPEDGAVHLTLGDAAIAELWLLFSAIHDTWGDEQIRVEDMASGWKELISVKSSGVPSYRDEYQSACSVLKELRKSKGEQLYGYLFFDPAVRTESQSNPTSPLARLKNLVIDEFIRVYVSSGGFRAYGGTNYGGFVSGSRYRTTPPYRIAEGG